MPYKEKKVQKLYYSIKEVAQMFNVKESLLRFWEKEFPQINPKKTEGRTRQYSKENIETIKMIYHLVKERGMTLPGARQRMADNKGETTRNFEVVSRLKEIKEELLAIKKELDRYPDTSSILVLALLSSHWVF